MKPILIFAGLKIAEIVGIVFVPYWVGRLVLLKVSYPIPTFIYWCFGTLAILFSSVFWMPLSGFIKWNWELAKKIGR